MGGQAGGAWWGVFGRDADGRVWRVGMGRYATKQEARAAKHRAIRSQQGDPFRPRPLRFFAARIGPGGRPLGRAGQA